MSFLLHASTCLAYLRNNARVGARIQQHQGNLHVSVITSLEIELALLDPRTPLGYTPRWFTIVGNFTFLPVDGPIVHRAALIGHDLRRQGRRIGTAALLVAATAVLRGLTLVTTSTAAFQAIAGLTLVDWSAP